LESKCFRGSDEWPTINNMLVPGFVPSSPFKLDEHLSDMLQEKNINNVCNEAFDITHLRI
jgi:hypothetical protein